MSFMSTSSLSKGSSSSSSRISTFHGLGPCAWEKRVIGFDMIDKMIVSSNRVRVRL